MIPDRFAPLFDELRPLVERFTAAGHRLYLVGGSVRDLFVDPGAASAAEPFDVDLTTPARPDEIKRLVDGWADAVWTQGERFGTIGALRRGRAGGVGDRVVEITTHRAEVYRPDSRKPQVAFADDVVADLSRRDYTVNAMALELTAARPELVDPFDGAGDLARKVLRTPLSPAESFGDDPLRMLRAARFIARLRLRPVPEVVAAVRSMAARLEIVSAERVRDELDKLLVTSSPGPGLWFFVDTGLAEHVLPELPALRVEQDPVHRHKDVLTHTVAVVENVRPPAERPHRPAFALRRTRLAALLHDVGKPRTRAIDPRRGVTFHHHDVVGARMARERMQALRYSNDDVDAVTTLVALHLRVHTYELGWSDAAVRRYVRDAGTVLHELNELTRADCTTRDPRRAAVLAQRMDELEARIAELAEREELAALRPELDGGAVMALLGIPPGRDVGRALAFLLEVRLDEGLLGEEEAERRLRDWWAAEGSRRE